MTHAPGSTITLSPAGRLAGGTDPRDAIGDRVLHQVTVPEGLTVRQVAALLQAEPDLTGEIEKLPAEGRLLPETYAFQQPVSPHWAAELDEVTLDPGALMLPAIPGPLVVETAGGLMVPLTRSWLQIDQLQEWNRPVVLVARSGLGTLNHTLLSLEALRKRRIPILGLILNGPPHADNPATLEQFGGAPVLGHLPPLRPLTAEALEHEWELQNLSDVIQTALEKLQ